jgi:hypothetical protein
MSEFRSLDLHVYCAGPIGNGEAQNLQLLFNAAVKATVILMTPTRRQDRAGRIVFQKCCDGGGTLSWIRKVVEPEFQEVLACFRFAPGLFEEPGNVGQSERDTYTWERAPLRHYGSPE